MGDLTQGLGRNEVFFGVVLKVLSFFVAEKMTDEKKKTEKHKAAEVCVCGGGAEVFAFLF